MYMRLVQLNVKEEALGELRSFYDLNIVPALRLIRGCLYAGLVQGSGRPSECVSMTFWDTAENADSYEKSGLFKKLLENAGKYLADTSEWKILLTEDLSVQYEEVREEPVVNAYHLASSQTGELLSAARMRGIYLRVVSPQLRPGKEEEFKRIYTEDVLPKLRTVRGCRYAALIEHTSETRKMLSMSIWDSKQDADDYEISGTFDDLTDKVKHTFSEIYQWKMRLEQETGNQVVTSEELRVEGYSVVAGQSFF